MEICASTFISLEFDHGHYGCLVLMDTEREKSIDLGPDYPFGKLKPGECVMSSALADTLSVGNNKVKIGSEIDILINLKNMTNT